MLSQCIIVCAEKLIFPELVTEFLAFLWNLKVCYHVHNGIPLVPLVNHISPVYAFLSCFFKICISMIFLFHCNTVTHVVQ